MTEGARVGTEVLVKLGNLTGREKVGGSQRTPLLTKVICLLRAMVTMLLNTF